MVESVFKIIGAALSIWESKEKTKYYDRYVKLRGKYREEFNKEYPSGPRLDDYEYQLRLLAEALSTKIGE